MAKAKQNTRLEASLAACKEPEATDTRDFLARVGDKWTILIIIVLANRPHNRARFSEIKNAIEGISQTMLTSTLRSLERDGIIVREIFPEVPPRVEYELTKFGVGLFEPMKTLAEWVVKNWSAVKSARSQFDQKEKKK